MHIELVLRDSHVEVIFTNTTSAELRLWELSNSWGYWSVSFQIKSDQNSRISTILHDWNTEWTVNFPSTFGLTPGEKRSFLINLNDGWWKREQTISYLKDKPLLARVRYQAEPANAATINWIKGSHEQQASEIARVFTGPTVSDWLPSQPPHEWLFASIPYTGAAASDLSQYPVEEVLRRICVLVDSSAWLIGNDAKTLNGDPVAPLVKLEAMQSSMTVGHLATNIAASAEEIRRVVSEARAYLEGKTGPPVEDKADTTK